MDKIKAKTYLHIISMLSLLISFFYLHGDFTNREHVINFFLSLYLLKHS